MNGCYDTYTEILLTSVQLYDSDSYSYKARDDWLFTIHFFDVVPTLLLKYFQIFKKEIGNLSF